MGAMQDAERTARAQLGEAAAQSGGRYSEAVDDALRNLSGRQAT
jgi:hypothetical protein